MKRIAIDINSDVGERPEALRDGSEELLLREITSANIACGGHAGNRQSMRTVIRLARKYAVNVGAHPGFPDRTNFGRREMDLTFDEIKAFVFKQVKFLLAVAKQNRVPLIHVKPHGALYNMAAKDSRIAHAIAAGVEKLDKSLMLIGLAGSQMLNVWKEMGFRIAAEAFGDRKYEPDGSLRSRKFPDALITNSSEAAQQALGIARDGLVVARDGSRIQIDAATICIHSDTPHATEMVAAIRKELELNGIAVSRLK
jgi:UPF0271 protein